MNKPPAEKDTNKTHRPFSFRVRRDLVAKVRLLCTERGITVTQLLIFYLQEVVERDEEEKRQKSILGRDPTEAEQL